MPASTAYNEIVNVRREYALPHGPPADWSTAGECSHAVQFYETDGHLLDLLTRFVGTALVSGDIALVIATKPHRDGLNKRLKANGLDIGVPREQGRFIALGESGGRSISASKRCRPKRYLLNATANQRLR